MRDQLKGKSAIIVGATKGIGEGIASVFAQQGCRLVLAARNLTALDELATSLQQTYDCEVKTIGVDITCCDQIQSMVEQTLTHFGRIDILCQNAGIYPKKMIDAMTEADWDKVHNVNLKGTFFTMQKCLSIMRQQRYGKVVLISSITGPRVGHVGLAHYSATKGGINGLIKTAALEYAEDNITVNVVEPGNIDTVALKELGEQYLTSLRHNIPMKRLGAVEDIGHAAAFLASDQSKYITGQSIIVDGGLILPETFGGW